MKKVLLALVVLPTLGYAGYVLTMAVPAAERSLELSGRVNKLGALAEAGAQRLKTSTQTRTLNEACAALAPVDRLQLLGYFGEPEGAVLAPLERQAMYFPAKQIFAMKTKGETRWDQEEEVKHVSLPWYPRSAGKFFEDLLTSPPSEWSWRKQRWNEPFNHPLSEVRYLVVHQLQSLKLPTLVGGTSYQAGAMFFRSSILNASNGQTLCEGLTTLSQNGVVDVRGRGHTEADAQRDLEGSKDRALIATYLFQTYEFALGTVCALGGAELCRATGYPPGR